MSILAHHRLRQRLGAFVDGELETGAAERIETHLRSCWSCSGEVQTLRLLKAVLARRRPTGTSLPAVRRRRFARALKGD